MKEIIITANEQNQRLDKFLFKYFNTAPKSFVYKMLRKKRIKYNKKKAEGSELLVTGDVLQMYLAEDTIDNFMEEKEVVVSERHFGIVYEDDNVILVSKPAGLLTHPEKTSDKDTLIDQILYYLNQKGQYIPTKESSFTPAVCNRLDRNTSGIVIAGKNLMAVQNINKAIAEYKLEKYYITVVKGKMSRNGEIVGYLTKNYDTNQVSVSDKESYGSKKVITRYTILGTTNEYSLLEIHLVTGKSHQIRAHLQSIGHPVIGDRKYGDEKVNLFFKQKYALSNQFLHAYKMVWNDKESQLSYLSNKDLTTILQEPFYRIKMELFG